MILKNKAFLYFCAFLLAAVTIEWALNFRDQVRDQTTNQLISKKQSVDQKNKFQQASVIISGASTTQHLVADFIKVSQLAENQVADVTIAGSNLDQLVKNLESYVDDFQSQQILIQEIHIHRETRENIFLRRHELVRLYGDLFSSHLWLQNAWKSFLDIRLIEEIGLRLLDTIANKKGSSIHTDLIPLLNRLKAIVEKKSLKLVLFVVPFLEKPNEETEKLHAHVLKQINSVFNNDQLIDVYEIYKNNNLNDLRASTTDHIHFHKKYRPELAERLFIKTQKLSKTESK